MEAFLVGFLSHTLIHIRPLEVLALGCVSQVLSGAVQAAQMLEPQLGMLFLIICGSQEQSCNLLIALLFCLGCEVGILVASLRLPCECLPKIFLGFGTGIGIFLFHRNYLLLKA